MDPTLKKWFYVTPSQKKKGPVSQDELIKLHIKGYVARTTLVWAAGMDEWEEFAIALQGLVPPALSAPEKTLPVEAPKKDVHDGQVPSPLASHEEPIPVETPAAMMQESPPEVLQTAVAPNYPATVLPLGWAYWGLGVFGSGLVVPGIIFGLLQPNPTAGAVFAGLVACLIFQIYAWIQIWKSATAYQKNKVWAFLAKLSVVAGFFITTLIVLSSLVGIADSLMRTGS